jgi:diguanylate cyclase (GGDEF)-like protein
VGVLMLALDHFKSVNDQHGHSAGDDVLREFGQRLAGAIRTTDFAARLGGEEFGVILSGSNREGIAQFAERFRAEVASRAFKAGGETLSITVSLGGASMQAEDTSPEQALERADKNLYRAKEAGRNRVDLG